MAYCTIIVSSESVIHRKIKDRDPLMPNIRRWYIGLHSLQFSRHVVDLESLYLIGSTWSKEGTATRSWRTSPKSRSEKCSCRGVHKEDLEDVVEEDEPSQLIREMQLQRRTWMMKTMAWIIMEGHREMQL